MTDRLPVAIVGTGGIAHSHARAYLATGRVELVAVADIVVEKAQEFAARYGVEHVHDSATSLLADHHPALVSLSTPPDTHADLAVEVLASGADVLVEKPPTISLAELDRIAAAEAVPGAGRAYGVFQHRYGSGALGARAQLAAGSLGDPRVVVCETLWFRGDGYFDPDWRGTWAGEGGGPTLGHGIHQFDLMLQLMGPWRSVSALTARVARPVEFEDVSIASVIFESGAVGSVINSLLSPKELSRIRIDTTSGTLEVRHVYGYDNTDWTWHPVPTSAAAAKLGRLPGARDAAGHLATGDGAATEPSWLAENGQVPSNHAAQITRLVDDLLAGRGHDGTVASARTTMEFVSAVYASGLTGRPVDRTALVPGHPFYDSLSGGRPASEIAATMITGARP